jgi:hypothetical protein
MDAVPANTILFHDTRTLADFRIFTFSNYKKTEVKAAYIDTMLREKMEASCYWCAELLCSGHLADLWDALVYFMSKYVHIANPKLPLYIHHCYTQFAHKMNTDMMYCTELDARNDADLRRLFIEMTAVMVVSRKKSGLEHIKIDRAEEFNMAKTTADRLKAPSSQYAARVFRPDDPPEVYIAVNELCFHIEMRDCKNAFYWVDWLLELDTICRRRKEPLVGTPRRHTPVADKYYTDVVWLIWDVFAAAAAASSFVDKVVDSLYRLFCVRYTSGICKKKRFLLYHTICILTEPLDLDTPVFGNKDSIKLILQQLDAIFLPIHEKEVIGETVAPTHYTKSIQKLKWVAAAQVLPPPL